MSVRGRYKQSQENEAYLKIGRPAFKITDGLKFTNGKYTGKKVDWVFDNDRKYYDWGVQKGLI